MESISETPSTRSRLRQSAFPQARKYFYPFCFYSARSHLQDGSDSTMAQDRGCRSRMLASSISVEKGDQLHSKENLVPPRALRAAQILERDVPTLHVPCC